MTKSKKGKKQPPQLKFSQRLVLNQYLLNLFGAKNFKDLSRDLKRIELEVIDCDGVTGFLPKILQRNNMLITNEKLVEYDRNIVGYLNKINARRDSKLYLKYFQYLSLLFVEYYLDMYFNNKQTLLKDLNEYLNSFNIENPNDVVPLYEETDLNKIAFWNATGSGKTILMHINYYQYLFYAQHNITDDTTIILLTPNDGLSSQHISEFSVDGIDAEIYDKKASRGMFTQNNVIQVLENSKLADKDGDKTVAVSRFGSKNLLFVDEGHKGSSGDKWMPFRNKLCKDGFSFEYSATFGQAVKSSGKVALIDQYAKCILFDYSYYYFYNDGYGKDYNIINMADISDDTNKKKYLTACLMTYYQQKKFYYDNNINLGNFNVENPLFVFVGHTVTASTSSSTSSEDKKTLSDVVEILLFFKEFSDKKNEYTSYISQILSGNSGLFDDKNRDVFARKFMYLGSLNQTPEQLYNDILTLVFNTKICGSDMHISNIKGVDGELAIKMGDNAPFGIINIGNVSALAKKLKDNGFETTTLDIGVSLFQQITNKDSTINLLIGSKKFTEGWNCWRVSTMGLMNVGRSEGSEIIQLFGRGVRLKGFKNSLKRSKAYKKFDDDSIVIPKFTEFLETLNIFGIRADYMQTFKEFLESEDIPSNPNDFIQVQLPVIKNKKALKQKLKTLRLPSDLNYKKDAPKPILKFIEGIQIVQDCYTLLQQTTSVSPNNYESTKDVCHFSNYLISLFDYNLIWLEIENYKNEKNRYNVHIQKDELLKLLNNTSWYKIYIPKQEMDIHNFSDLERMQNIAISLLKKYFDKFYMVLKNEWETPLMQYVEVDDSDPNFIDNDKYLVTIQDPENNDDIKSFVENLSKNIEAAKLSGDLESISNISNAFIKSFSFANNLYNPYLYINGKTTEISISPVSLVQSEYDFVCDLKSYIDKNVVKINDSEIYIIRNRSKKGVGFFVESGFYPDFIMWIIKGEKQYITFIDPHGMGRESIKSEKVQLFNLLKRLEDKLDNNKIILNSFILSPTSSGELIDKQSKTDWKKNHVLFMEDNYIEELINAIII